MKQTCIILLLLRLHKTDAFTVAAPPPRVVSRRRKRFSFHSPLKRSSDFKHRHHLSTREASNASSVNGDIVSQERRVLDSEALFEADVTRVIQELRPWPQDPSVPAYFAGSKLSFTNYWSLDDWERHNSRWRFFRYARGFPTSRLLRRIAPQLAGLFVWSLLAVALHSRFIVFSRVRVPLSALSMISTFVAALLTLRTNQGLDRLIMGRNSLGNMVFFSRDAAMLFSTYIYPKDEQLGLKAARLLSLFGWALHSHIRDISQIDVIRAILPARNMNASFKYVTRQRKAPVALLSMLRQIVCETSKSRVVSTTESRLIEQCISGLNKVIMKAEKIRSTPIPPVYSAHATRLMMFYLGCLPWALLGLNLNDFASLAMTMVVGFAMLGLDEISHIFEQPFRFMPLYQLAKVSMLDVADAFCCRPPPISADYCEDESIEDKEEPQEPTYWKGLNGSIPYYKPASKRKNPLWKNA